MCGSARGIDCVWAVCVLLVDRMLLQLHMHVPGAAVSASLSTAASSTLTTTGIFSGAVRAQVGRERWSVQSCCPHYISNPNRNTPPTVLLLLRLGEPLEGLARVGLGVVHAQRRDGHRGGHRLVDLLVLFGLWLGVIRNRCGASCASIKGHAT